LTGTRLASQAGFQQAHISNFLNRKRALSLEGLDRVLASQHLTVEQILPFEITAAASPASDPVEVVPVVSASTAMEVERISPAAIIETIQLSASQLANHRSRPSPKHARRDRFVGIRIDTEQTSAMEPLLSQGAIAILDRHYNSLAPYRAHQPTLYAVRNGASLVLRFVELDEGCLILRPYSMQSPVKIMRLAEFDSPAEHVIGRVCMVYSEL
jgi:hypothetical protein